jgi:hypothetical protein
MKRIIVFVTLAGLFVAGCENDETPKTIKLDYYVDSFTVAGLDFQPQVKVQYKYNSSGDLEKYTVYSYNPTSSSFEEQRHFSFSYQNDQVNKIEGFLVNASSAYITYNYEYSSDARLSKISENNSASGLTSEANFTYNAANDSVKVAYSYSNGGGFQYQFLYENKNIVGDKTTRGTQLSAVTEFIPMMNTSIRSARLVMLITFC